MTCAVILSDDEHIEKELHHLSKVFINNGYQERQIKRIIKKVQDGPRQKQREEDEVARITLPYIKGTTYIIAKILRKKNINVIFSPLNTIKKMLDQGKDKVDPNKRSGLYVIPLSCKKEYIGET